MPASRLVTVAVQYRRRSVILRLPLSASAASCAFLPSPSPARAVQPMAPQPARRAASAAAAPLAARSQHEQPWTRPPPSSLALRRSASLPVEPTVPQPVYPLPAAAGASSQPRRLARRRRAPRMVSPADSRADPLAEGVHTDEMFYWLTGVHKYQFEYFFRRYCGLGTPLNLHFKLFWLLRWYKQYPRGREMGALLGVRRHGQRILFDVQRWSAWLAGAIDNDEVLTAWRQRFHAINALPVPDALFGGTVTASIDTFPIYLCKPSDVKWQRYTYSGKYHANVLKVQMIIDNTGTPIWYSGPHLGTAADIRLARQHMPAGMAETERLLADKAYCASDMPHLTTPYKKQAQQRRKAGQPPPPPPPRLTRQQLAFNRVHRWYRATAEHAFAYLKRFRILGERYRGKLNCKQRTGFIHLHNALVVIINLCVYHNRCSQHRVHPPIPQVADAAMLSSHAMAQEPASDSDDGDSSSSSDSDSGLAMDVAVDAGVDVDAQARPARGRGRGRGRGSSSETEEQAAPASKRQRRRPRSTAAAAAAPGPAVDAHSVRADYGQYEYQWDEEAGTGYSDEQFKRGQAVWLWSLVLSTWMAAVVTQRRRGGGVFVRLVDAAASEGMAASMLRPRIAQ